MPVDQNRQRRTGKSIHIQCLVLLGQTSTLRCVKFVHIHSDRSIRQTSQLRSRAYRTRRGTVHLLVRRWHRPEYEEHHTENNGQTESWQKNQ